MSPNTNLIDQSLLPGPNTFTEARIRQQLQDDTFKGGPEFSPPALICESLEYSLEDGLHRYYSDAEQTGRRQKLCCDLYEALNTESYCQQLDRLLSPIVQCNFQPEEGTDEISDRAHHLLSRLPAIPLELPNIPETISPKYFTQVSCMLHENSSPSVTLWDQLQVTSYVSASVIRTALLSIIYQAKASGMLQNFIDTLADLLSTAGDLSSSQSSGLSQEKWFVVRAFLWTSWQRSSMIYFYTVLGRQLKFGFNDQDGPSLILRGPLPCPDLSIQKLSKNLASMNKPQYMCGWAFELLRNDSICIGMDFRRFFFRYSKAFGDRRGRCIASSHASCLGDQPDKCQRFKGLKISDQSAHDLSCPQNCEPLFWNEVSYRSVSGAKAVALELDDCGKKLLYRQASANTLTVSHVWSHGQGGRPEAEKSGFNFCLHRRYVSLARSLSCDSYWMDTPCIPGDHVLRREAIENINQVFEQSRVTIVCDRDLMDIDASDLTVEVRELILGTILVCDWNLRAWTFLEAFRGRESIFILCKDNVIVPLKETVEIVHRQGSIDIALLLLSAPHLLPPQIKKYFQNPSYSPFISGFLTVETAANLLGHREASRPGDDMVIWSLLLDDKVYKDATAFWKSRQGNSLQTGFLISSAPRLEERGLSWAPSSPTAQLTHQRSNGPTSRLLAFDGMESEAGLIRTDGFQARWFMYDFVGHSRVAELLSLVPGIDVQPYDRSCSSNLRSIRHRYLEGYRWGALLRPLKSQSSHNPAPNRGDLGTTLVIVCATNKRWSLPWRDEDDRIHWKWRGVYEWDMIEPLPHFVIVEDVLLV